MNIHIILVAYALPEETWRLFAALDGADVTWHLFMHSRTPEILAVCRKIALHSNVYYNAYGENRGLARSWNEGLLAAYVRGADMAIIANDDVTATRDDLHTLALAALTHRDHYRVSATGWDEREKQETDMRFALAAVNPVALERIGCFDENFWPVYYEDLDWERRAELAGLRALTLARGGVVHQGSATRYSSPEAAAVHQATFWKNRNYYILKWGGFEGEERVTVPFNNDAFGLRIAPSSRGAPYPGYNRTDLP